MKRALCMLLSIILVAGLCACGGGDAYVPTGDALYRDEDYTGPTVTKPREETDQSLVLTYYPDRSMNPLVCTDYTNRTLFSLMYQSLFTVDRDYVQEPQLCKNYRVSEDMRTYTFYVENAAFWDGTPLTAADVLASLAAAKESDYYKGRFLHITDMTLSSDGGIVLTLSTPFENLPLLLDIPVVKQSEVSAQYPMGTGPYALDVSAQTPILRRNTTWWCKAELVVTAPAITLIPAESPAGIRDDFEFSGLSLVCADPGSDRYADYRCDYELWDCENNIFLYLSCNMGSEVFSVPEVRSALTYAIDRDSIVEEFYRGFARSASLPASPLSPNYSQVLAEKYAYNGGEGLTQAVTDAALTAKPVILLVNKDDSLRLRVARSIGKILQAAGLDVQMQELSGNAYIKALRERTYDLYLGQTKLSANMDLTPFFSDSGALNYGGIGEVGLYTLCTEAFANHGNYYTLHQKVMDDGRLVPILFRSYAVYATRGLLTELAPTRDNVFYYSLGKTMEKALIKE